MQQGACLVVRDAARCLPCGQRCSKLPALWSVTRHYPPHYGVHRLATRFPYLMHPDPILAHLSDDPDDYFAKGTTEHLTFLRVMREAHQQFPFTCKKDTDLIENAVEMVLQKLPVLRQRAMQTQHVFYMNTMFRIAKQRKRKAKS